MQIPAQLQEYEQDDWISAIKFDSNNKQILVGYYDKMCRILDQSGNLIAGREFDSGVKSVQWISDSKAVSGTQVINLHFT